MLSPACDAAGAREGGARRLSACAPAEAGTWGARKRARDDGACGNTLAYEELPTERTYALPSHTPDLRSSEFGGRLPLKRLVLYCFTNYLKLFLVSLDKHLTRGFR